MDLLAWALLLFFGWGSVPTRTAVRTPDASVGAPSDGAHQVQAMHDGTPIPPK